MPALRILSLLRSVALAALTIPAAQPAFAQQQRQPPPQLVESVNVVGNRRLTAAEILKHIKTRPGDPFDQEQPIRDFHTLMNLGFFDRRVSRVVFETGLRGGVEVFFVTRELPLIEFVEFEGLGRGDEAALIEGLRRRRLEVSVGGVYDPDKVRNSVTVMKELLRERGWRRVEVETLKHPTSSDTVKLIFVVNGLPPQKRLDGPKRPDAVARLTHSA